MKQQQFLHLACVEQWTYDEISKKIGVDRKNFKIWWEELKPERDHITQIRTLYNRKKFKKVKFPEFYEWVQNHPKQCHYCDITEEMIKELLESGKLETKRIKTRGKKLELERQEPNEPYDNLDNLVWSCYFCNSSKSDVFSPGEFKEIGEVIKGIWKERLKK